MSISGTDPDRLLATEWLLTNGLGGFALGTAAGVPARRYHGLLVGAAMPPVGRFMALNALVLTLDIAPGMPEARSLDLTTFRFGAEGQAASLHPAGPRPLSVFEFDGISARWKWEVADESSVAARFAITQQLTLPDRDNAAVLGFTLSRRAAAKSDATPLAARLRIRPLVSMRDIHALTRRAWSDRFHVADLGAGRCAVSMDGRTLHLASGTTFMHSEQWWYNFFYSLDADRGQDCREDLFSPGEFQLDLLAEAFAAGAELFASLTDKPVPPADQIRAARQARLNLLSIHAAGSTTQPPSAADQALITTLVRAADQFVVVRAAPSARSPLAPESLTGISIIAGYPWFSDWGRDTFVSLPGLLLSTGRFDDARRTLLAFAARRKNGIIPNVFNDQTGEPEYNTVDASLWFIHAACAYLDASADRAGFDRDLLPACLDIIAAYRRGTDFNIAMDPQDKLITAGAPGTQLTWMDAKRDGVVFTPRHGKPVEVNALWHSALRRLAEAARPADPTCAANLNDLASNAGRSFRKRFWNAGAACLFDMLTPIDGGWSPVADIRPNQLFAISLPHSPLSTSEQKAVLACVRDRLYTPMGLRTLDPADPRFKPRYQGNLFERDAAYHNGAAWPWLLGPYAEAILRVGGFSDGAKRESRAALNPILETLTDPPLVDGLGGCAGQIAEIYDGTEPQRPQGCTAQAWSIAEVLRVLLMTL